MFEVYDNLSDIIDIFSKKSNFTNINDVINKRPWKYFYRNLVPKVLRKKLDYLSKVKQERVVKENWDVVVENYFLGKFNYLKNRIVPKKLFSDSKIIWQYWEQGWDLEHLPDIVKLCYKSVEQYKGEYQVIRLDKNNFHEYIDFPEFVLNKKNNFEFKAVFFSDLLRIALLKCYGGVWLDATVLLTDVIPSKFSNVPYFLFQRDDNCPNKQFWHNLNKDYFSWNNSSIKMLSSIIFSQKDNIVISSMLDLLLLFWQTQIKIPHYFFFQILYDSLIGGYLKEFQCEIVDDTLPHILYSKFNEEFDVNEFDRIKNITFVHKLTYIKECKDNSFYMNLRNIYQLDK